MAGKTYIYVGAMAEIAGSGGVWRKEASDDHWEDLSGNGLPPMPEGQYIAVHPDNPEIVYVGTQRGLYKSVDRGDHWKRADMAEGPTVFSIAFRPDNPRVMYLGATGNDVYRSDDSGDAWTYMSTIVNPDQIEMHFPIRILWLSMEAANPDVMYAATEVGGAARSMDAGKTWQIINNGLKGEALLDLHTIAVGSPKSDAVFIANRTGVWRSRDRGDKWENLHMERFSPIIYSRGVRIAPDDPNTVYACICKGVLSEEGGVMRSKDLGDTWERFDHGVTAHSSTFGVAINRQQPEQVYFVTYGAPGFPGPDGPSKNRGEVFGTHDHGATWQEHPLPENARDLIGLACAPG